MKRLLIAVATAGAISACATGRMIVLQGEPSSLTFLAGEWDGTFSNPENAMQGSLWFALIAGEDHAHGDVRMTPKDRLSYNRFDPREGSHQLEPTTYLDIRWVRVADFKVEGKLEPFMDPLCGCRAETTFYGTLGDNRLDGTYTTRLADGTMRSGYWRAVRTKRGR